MSNCRDPLKTQVMTVPTILLQKIASCINLQLPVIIFRIHFRTCIIVKRICISIFSKVGLVDLQSKLFTQICKKLQIA